MKISCIKALKGIPIHIYLSREGMFVYKARVKSFSNTGGLEKLANCTKSETQDHPTTRKRQHHTPKV